MDIKEEIRNDLWNAIKSKYSHEDYTEAVRDAIFFTSEIIREKSGQLDKDGNKLIESVFLGKNPSIKITKRETVTERNIQEGIGYAFKGIISSIRNPISHQNIGYLENEANAILLYINYLLSIIDKSQGYTIIEDFITFVKDSDFPENQEYAKDLVKEVPSKKRLDLLVQLFNIREKFEQNQINNFVKELDSKITASERKILVDIIDKEMLLCKDNPKLRMFLNIFFPLYYKDLSLLTTRRLENILYRSLCAGESISIGCNPKGDLSTWISGNIQSLESKDKFYDKMLTKVLYGKLSEKTFIYKYFNSDLFNYEVELNESRKSTIHKLLQKGDINFIKNMHFSFLFDLALSDNTDWAKEFKEELETAFQKIEDLDEIPF